MRRPEDLPLDPEMVTALEAIDATLAGEPVDPRHAELAELALMLAADRPVIEEGFARLLDGQVNERSFSRVGARTRDAGPSGAARKPRKARSSRSRWWVWAPGAAVAASLVAAVVIVAGESGRGSSGSPSFAVGTTASPSSSGSAAVPRSPLVKAAAAPKASPTTTAQHLALLPGSSHHHSSPNRTLNSYSPSSSASSTAQTIPTLSGNTPYLAPPNHGRKVIQAAQLTLSTSSKRIDQVSQEVYNVVGQENGIVKNSNITSSGARGGYAQFLLSVPSSNLSRTMADLSTLPYATVESRTDSTQDVTNQYRFQQQQLGDAQALRTSLLKQLANAVTQAQIDSLTTRIHDAEAQINSDESALHSLQRSISYSQVNVSISSGAIPVAAHKSGGFTLGRAAHDAGRVLTVAAGVALIVLAALLPVGLLVALLWWIGRGMRRRSRQQALDLA